MSLVYNVLCRGVVCTPIDIVKILAGEAAK